MRHFDKVSISEFSDFVRAFQWTRRITEVHLHHTWRPRRADDRGLATVQGMWRHHTQVEHWDDIAQHVTIGADGTIWLGRNFNWAPASASGFNGNSSAGPFMIEMIGDFDTGRETLSDAQRAATVAVIETVQARFDLPASALRFHNEMSSKTCPGSSQDKAEWIKAIDTARAGTASAARGKGDASRAAFETDVTRVFGLVRSMQAAAPQTDDMSTAEHGPGSSTEPAEADGARGLFGGIDPAIPLELADHAVNLTDGRFSNSGIVSTDATDVDRIFGEKLPAEVAAAKAQGRQAQLLLYAHGGLVSEETAVRAAWDQLRFWQLNGVYPLFFIWETGLAETLKAMLLGSRGARDAAARGFVSDITDRFIEDRAHEIGRPIWSGMKRNAERAHDDVGGGTYVAKKLRDFLKTHGEDVDLHIVGHSAGSIFMTRFLQILHPEVTIRTAHFLAPAITNDLFNDAFAPAVDGKRIGKLTLFTMKKARELRDTVTPLYRKSLLYLIHKGLERERPTEILGLEESLRRDPKTAKLFGLAGAGKAPAEIVWSDADAGPCRHSTSLTHGDFDNDAPTLNSVCRIVLGRCEQGDIVGYQPRKSRGAAGMWDLDTLPEFPGAPAAASPSSPTSPGPAPTPAPAFATTTGGARRALCIGIDAYQAINPLGGCVNDKNNWLAAFREAGFEIFGELENGQATAERISATLRDFVASGSSGDQLVLQFAGHGTQFADTSGDEAFDSCFCAVDCNAEGPQGGLVLDDHIYEILGTMKPGVRLTMFTDCCHSGTVSRAMIAPPTPAAPSSWKARYAKPTARMVSAYEALAARGTAARAAAASRNIMTDATLRATLFAACQDNELAWESEGSGAFTRLAVRELATARGLTNRQFHDRVIKAFGSDKRQTPNLYCRPEDLDAPFIFG